MHITRQNLFSIFTSFVGIFYLLQSSFNIYQNFETIEFIQTIWLNLKPFTYPLYFMGKEFGWSTAQSNNIAIIICGFLFAGSALSREMGPAAPLAMLGLVIYVITRSGNAIHEVKHNSGFLTKTGTDKLVEKLGAIYMPVRFVIVTLSLLFGAIFFDHTLSIWGVQLGPATSSVIGGFGALLFSVIFLVFFISWKHVLTIIISLSMIILVQIGMWNR